METLVRFRQCMLYLMVSIAVPVTVVAGQMAAGVQVVHSTPTFLEIEYRPQVLGLDTVAISGVQTVLPGIAGAELAAEGLPGEPSHLIVRIPVAVPSEEGFHLAQIVASNVAVQRQVMAPVPSVDTEREAAVPRYTLNRDAYSRASLPSWARVVYAGQARDLHIAYLEMTAARFNSASGSVEIPALIRVRINFLPTSVQDIAVAEPTDLPVAAVNAREAARWRMPQALAKRIATAAGEHRAWLRIGVDSEGVYSISAQALRDAGLSVAVDEVATLKLFGYGGMELPEQVSRGVNNELIEQPIIVRTTPSGELQSVLFYGAATSGFVYTPSATGTEKFSHYINHYSSRNYYVLTVGGEPGRRAQAAQVPEGAVVNTPRQYTARLFTEEELYNPFSPGSDRRWFGRITNKDIPTTYTTVLPNLVKHTGASIFYRYCVVNRSNYAANFVVSEHGRQIGTTLCSYVPQSYSFAYAETDVATISASDIPDDRSVLQFLYTNANGGQSASGHVDWFEIHYPREMVAVGNEIELYSDPAHQGITEYSINGFSGEIFGFDVTDRAAPVLLKNMATTGGMFVFRADLAQEAPRRFYIASTLKAPATVEAVDVAGLRNTHANTDVVLITHKAFLESAQAYKAYRESQGELTVSVVTTDQIYNEFAAGMPDPTAIRDFLAFTLRHWQVKPRYAILWGDGHYDYKNISTAEPVYIPTYQTLNDDGVFHSVETTSMIEDYFARISGNDLLIDIALGRIPIRSNAEGNNVVEKIRHYENNSSRDLWRTRITLIADDAWTTDHPVDGEGILHTPQSEALSTRYILPAMSQKKIYMPEYPTENIPGGRRKPRVAEELLNAVNNGTLILNWIGHGNPRVWAHEQIFEKDLTIPLMQNLDKLFFLTAATCDFGRIDDPNRQSGAEELFTSTVGGAIGVFSATRTVYSHQNAALNETFYSHLMQPGDSGFLRLGDAVFLTKQTKTGRNDEKFFLLGDPTLRLLMPQQQIRVTSINGKAVPADTLPQVQALSTVTITGEVMTLDASGVDNTFDGSVVFSLYDSDIDKVVKDVGDSSHRYFVFGGLLNISADSVRNGLFTVTMVVPQDISFSDMEGRLNAYAFSKTSTAMGSTRDFTIGGVDTNAVNDGNGPVIDVFMDTYTFRPGDLVRPEPVLMLDLYDETGINATGLGIGHDIEAWIDDAPNSIRLTRDFTISLEDFRKGTVVKQLFDLEPGTHRIRVRAWDVFNNFSEVETSFRIAGDDGLHVEDVYSYPNPFAEQTTIAFRHNQLGSVASTVSIYSAEGRLVRTIRRPVDTRSAAIEWDGRNDAGSRLPSGVYLYKLQLSSDEGLYKEAEGRLVIVR